MYVRMEIMTGETDSGTEIRNFSKAFENIMILF